MNLATMFLGLALVAGGPVERGPAPARAPILEVIPADARAVVVVHDWPAAREKLTALRVASFAAVNPAFSTVLRGLAIVDGLDEHGTIAAVVMGTADGLLLVLPTADVAKLMTLWEPEPLDEGAYRVRLMGRESFLAARDGYALIGPSLDVVLDAARCSRSLALRLPSYLQDRMRRYDVGAWVDAQGVGGRGVWPGSEGPAGWWSRAGRWLLGNQRQIMAGLRFGISSISVEAYLEPVDPIHAALRETNRPLFGALPEGDLALAVSMINDDRGSAMAMLDGAIMAALLQGELLDSSRASELASRLESIGRRTNRVLFSAGSAGRGTIEVTEVLRSRGTAGMLLGELRSLVRFLQSGPAVDERINRLLGSLVYRRAAETIDGVVVDQLGVEFPEGEPADYEAVKRVLGPEGLLVRVGAVDDRYVVLSVGGGVRRFQAVVGSVRGRADPVRSGSAMASVASHLPAERSMEAYFFPSRMVALLEAWGSALRTPDGVYEFAASPAPVGATLSTEGAGLLWRVVIPADVLRSLKRREPAGSGGAVEGQADRG